jgi:sugar phosphate isomerase/epimerase
VRLQQITVVPALAQISTLNSPFRKDIEDYAAGECSAIEIWWGKLERFLAEHSVADVLRLLEGHEMAAPVASFQGGLLVSQGEARREAWRHFAQRLRIARELDIQTLVIADEVHAPLAAQDVERFRHSLAEAAAQAAAARVRLALEFQARSHFCNNLQTAVALVEEVASPHLGVCLDAFHFEVGPSKTTDLGLLTRDNLFHVQLCDLADTPREFATDSDRILPGDGDIPLATIVERLMSIDYDGYVAVELMNPRVFQVPALSFGEIAMTALRRVLGLASMGEA